MQTKFYNCFKKHGPKNKNLTSTPLESQEQIALINWWSFYSQAKHIHEKCLFAIPNGGSRNAIEARNLKAEGVRAGIPDLMLALPCGAFHGLFIEMKRLKKGRLSADQKEMLEVFSKLGYKAAVCFGFENAKLIIEEYLNEYSEEGLKN